MTPPVQQHALEASSVARPFEVAQGRRGSFAGDLVALTDVWVLLAVLWAARLGSSYGALDPGVALFGLVAFGLLLSPKATRTRRDQLTPSAIDDSGDVFRRTWLAYGVATAVAVATGIGDLRLLLAVGVFTAPALLIGRAASYATERSLRQRSAPARTLVVGAGEIARRVITTTKEHSEFGLEVLGVVDDDPRFDASELGARFLGRLEDVPALVRSHHIDTVIVAFSSGDQGRMVDVIRAAMASGASVWVVPRFFELSAPATGADHLWGLPLVKLEPPARSRPEWFLKRALDVAVSGIGIILTAPVMGLIALATWIDSGRPILLRQSRVSLDGRPFTILKFRTMAQAPSDVESTEWAADEDRMTRLGAILRRCSLDELPQLFNVLRGDMSLVGPRPERPYFVGLFSDLYPQYGSRHRVPAGITGWAQIHGLKGDTSIEERAMFDNYYIENWSLADDMKIIAKTAITFFREGSEGGGR